MFLLVIRIFFILGQPLHEKVGLADFAPLSLNRLNGESYSDILRRASLWCSQQVGVRFTNVQSIEMKLKCGELDTQRTSYTQHSEKSTKFAKFLRVAYVKSNMTVNLPPSPPLLLSYRCFPPCQLTAASLLHNGTFESMSQTVTRIAAWMGLTNAAILNIETCAVPIGLGHDATYSYKRAGEANISRVLCIRVYLDGVYEEPHSSQLPPIPRVIPSDDTCTVS